MTEEKQPEKTFREQKLAVVKERKERILKRMQRVRERGQNISENIGKSEKTIGETIEKNIHHGHRHTINIRPARTVL